MSFIDTKQPCKDLSYIHCYMYRYPYEPKENWCLSFQKESHFKPYCTLHDCAEYSSQASKRPRSYRDQTLRPVLEGTGTNAAAMKLHLSW